MWMVGFKWKMESDRAGRRQLSVAYVPMVAARHKSIKSVVCTASNRLIQIFSRMDIIMN